MEVEGAGVWDLLAISSSWCYGRCYGYVGVGMVTAPAVAVNDFEVEVDGAAMNILQVPSEAHQYGPEAHPEFENRCGEYLLESSGAIDVRLREEAFGRKGCSLNQKRRGEVLEQHLNL